MKKIFNLLYIILLMVFTSCITIKESDYITREYTLPSFSRIDISSAFNVQLKQGDVQSVIVEIEEHMLPLLKAEVQGDELNVSFTGRTRNTKPNKIYITVPHLKEVDLSGASSLNFETPVVSDKFKVGLSGASSIKGTIQAPAVGIVLKGASSAKIEVETPKISVNISGASSATLSGSATSQKLEASGASKINATALAGETASVKASGASKVSVGADNLSSIDSSGASKVSKK